MIILQNVRDGVECMYCIHDLVYDIVTNVGQLNTIVLEFRLVITRKTTGHCVERFQLNTIPSLFWDNMLTGKG